MSKGRKTWERGYAAGLMDGEGCIQVAKTFKNEKNGTRHRHFALRININMTDRQALDFMCGAFGGNVFGPFIYNFQHLPVFRWEIRCNKAMEFLKRVLLMLKTKKKQAELGIEFQTYRNKYGHDFRRGHPLHPSVGNKYEEYYQKMRRLKDYSIPRAAATTNRDDLKTGSDSLFLREEITVS